MFGGVVGPDTIALYPGEAPLRLALPAGSATYIVFVQAVADRAASTPPGFGIVPEDSPHRKPIESNAIGGLVSTYTIEYADGGEADVPIIRRLGIQQRHVCWGASPFAAMPALGPHVHATHGEDFILGRPPRVEFGISRRRWHAGQMTERRGRWQASGCLREALAMVEWSGSSGFISAQPSWP